MLEKTKKLERAVLAGLAASSMPQSDRSSDESLEELESLLETAGGECVGVVFQSRDKPDSGTFIGKGKVEEIKAIIEAEKCDLVLFDNELSPSQMRALSEELGIRVIDRSGIILDIFAQRARTREGKLQVELAQYNYLLPRLTGMWKHLVSQTGTAAPIGTRGPGETQLESDRRHIRRKITKLEEELDQVRRVRQTQSRQRVKNAVPVVALVGYTNAGKSTLLNAITGAGIQTGNRLFDTLDPTTRRIKLEEIGEVLLSDTVGFIQRLPHQLVKAFRATLEELAKADLLLHVIDASNPNWEAHAQVVNRLISELDADKTPRLEVFNQCDKPIADLLPHGEDILRISAKTGEGIDELLQKITAVLQKQTRRVTLRVPYDKAGMLESLHKRGQIINQEYQDAHIEVTANLGENDVAKFSAFFPGDAP